MATRKMQRGVSLNPDIYARFEEAAAATGETVAAWLTKAGEQRRRQQNAEATARYCAQPQVAAQIAQWTAATAPGANAVWAEMADA